MRYRVLGSTRLKVSEVGFGAWAIGGNTHGNSYGPTDDETSINAILKAVELGCNFFDTADVYGHGHSEELLGKATKGRRADMIIATKVGGDFYHGQRRMNFDPDYVEFAVDKSLERLGTDYLDLLQMHNPPLQLMRDPKLYLPFEKLKKTGKIRHYGVSIHNPQEGLEAIRYGRPESIQVVYNILRQEAKEKLFEAATEKNVGIIAREPLANGFLTGKYNEDSTFQPGDIRHNFPREYIRQLTRASEQLKFLESKHRTLSQASIRFVLDHKEISTVIPGAKGPTQSEQNMKSSNLPPLTGEELLRIKFLRQQVS